MKGNVAIKRTLRSAIFLFALGWAENVLAQVFHRDGPDMTCDDGRRGVLSGNAIIWSDGTPHPGVIIGNKSSVRVGPGVFVGRGKGSVVLDDPNAPNKTRCAILDGMSYCY